jgi:hypothetical protein
MKARVLKVVFAGSILLNLVALPVLGWKLAGLELIYRRNVDYAAELAYAVGYRRALGENLAAELAAYPTRLKLTEVSTNSVEVLLWPARNEYLRLEFQDPKICNADLYAKP